MRPKEKTMKIARVTYYTATEPTCCDRCAQEIKNVAVIRFADETIYRVGLDCAKRILDANPTAAKLFAKNVKLLSQLQDYQRILSGDPKDMPYGREYFNSGLYFIADSKGKDITWKRYVFHPLWDVEKNRRGSAYVVQHIEAERAKFMKDIQVMLADVTAEIARIERFLAKIMGSVEITATTR
jgi:hypothetical protein